jgi:hypothetical protein
VRLGVCLQPESLSLVVASTGRLVDHGVITMGRIFVIVGKVWLYLVAALVAVSYLRMLYIGEVWKLWETVNPPFNLWSTLATLLINGAALMLPGVALIGLGKLLGDDH